MIRVEEALDHLFGLSTPRGVETVPLRAAAGRVLARPARAWRDQPPFAASAMDGYAVRSQDAAPGAQLAVIGEAAAGHAWTGRIGPGEALRIFTGAPLPDGADRVIIQEDVRRSSSTITLKDRLDSAIHVRPAAADFPAGKVMEAPRRLRPQDIALLAAMNVAELTVYCKPSVAIIATGDELVMPGETPAPDQIIASNTFGLAALVEENGGTARLLPIARDTEDSLKMAFAMAAGADLILTVGGASVGDHDLVGAVAESLGLDRRFYKIAMRPGKPLMAGLFQGSAMVGLPGNPVSAMVCGHIFILPMLRAMQGLGAHPAPRKSAPLGADLAPNGPREHYMRARLADGVLFPASSQDSALLSVLADADALLIRPIDAPAARAGDVIEFIEV